MTNAGRGGNNGSFEMARFCLFAWGAAKEMHSTFHPLPCLRNTKQSSRLNISLLPVQHQPFSLFDATLSLYQRSTRNNLSGSHVRLLDASSSVLPFLFAPQQLCRYFCSARCLHLSLRSNACQSHCGSETHNTYHNQCPS